MRVQQDQKLHLPGWEQSAEVSGDLKPCPPLHSPHVETSVTRLLSVTTTDCGGGHEGEPLDEGYEWSLSREAEATRAMCQMAEKIKPEQAPAYVGADAAWLEIQQDFPRVLDGKIRPMRAEPYHLTVDPAVKPVQRWHARPIPINLIEAFDKEIDKQLKEGLLEAVEDINDASDWLHPMVVTHKKDPNECRITVDFRKLNEATVRPVRVGPSPWEKVSSIPEDAAFFTVVDGHKGYLQRLLDDSTSRMTTFLAAHRGPMRYKRLPMGLNVSQDVFVDQWERALKPCASFSRTVVEDTVIWGRTPEECIERTRVLFEEADKQDISFNPEKVQFCQPRVEFAGFILSKGHYEMNPALNEAVAEFPAPTNRTELRSFFGLAQQFGEFTPELTATLEQLRDLNKQHVQWGWTDHHQREFEKARKILASPACLTYFDPGRPTRLETDASKLHGLGFVLRQQALDGRWRAVQCGSRTLGPHEKNWSGVAELECLAVAWACKKTAYFLEGMPGFVVCTDIQPLVHLINNKSLDQLHNDRLVKMKAYLDRFNMTAEYIPGRKHLVPDALSRRPTEEASTEDFVIASEDGSQREFVVRAVQCLYALAPLNPSCNTLAQVNAVVGQEADRCIEEIKTEAQKDAVYQQLIHQLREGWPDQKARLPDGLKPYHQSRVNFTEEDGLVLFGRRIVIPAAMRPRTLIQLHLAHQGEVRTLRRARRSVWWPTVRVDVLNEVRGCKPCREVHLSKVGFSRRLESNQSAMYECTLALQKSTE